MQARTQVLKAEGLKKSYGERAAVIDVSLELAAGEVLGLLGPNGAGKSTTIAMVCGLTPPDAGRVLVGGTVLAQHGRGQEAHQGARAGPQGLTPKAAGGQSRLTGARAGKAATGYALHVFPPPSRTNLTEVTEPAKDLNLSTADLSKLAPALAQNSVGANKTRCSYRRPLLNTPVSKA